MTTENLNVRVIPLPYNLATNQLILESWGHPPTESLTVWDQLNWLKEEANTDDEDLELIFRSTVILKNRYPNASLADCLNTAIVWHNG